MQEEHRHDIAALERRLASYERPRVDQSCETERVLMVDECLVTNAHADRSHVIIEDLTEQLTLSKEEVTRLNSYVLQLRTELDIQRPADVVLLASTSNLEIHKHPLVQAQLEVRTVHVTLAQLQAHRNEAIVWRTKASEMEITLRELQSEMITRGMGDAQTVRATIDEARRRSSVFELASPTHKTVNHIFPTIPQMHNGLGWFIVANGIHYASRHGRQWIR
jgi:hypothetical protein